jgi:hypothetical protein
MNMVTTLEAAGTALAVCLVVGGALVRRGDWGFRVLAAGAWLLVLINFLPGAGGPWLLINSAAIFGALTVGLIASTRAVVIGMLTLPLILHFAWAANPQAVVATGYEVLGGWVPPLQVACVLILTSLAWKRASKEAQRADVGFEEQEQTRDHFLAERARQSSRRRAVVRVHETLLNTIKCALDPNPSSDVLRSIYNYASASTIQGNQGAPMKLRDAVATAIRPWADRVSVHFLSGSGVVLPGITAEVLISALVELLRNTFRHEDNPSIRIDIGSSGTHCEVRITGIHVPENPELLGIGLREAVLESISDVRGEVVTAEDVMLIRFPRGRGEALLSYSGPTIYIQSRSLMAAVLTGVAIGGSPYLFALAFGGMSMQVTAVIAAMSGGLVILLALLQYRKVRVHLLAGIGMLAAAAAIPWLAVLAFGDGCAGMGQTLASAMNLSGLILVALSLWSNPWLLLPGLAAWGAGIGLLLNTAPAACTANIPTAVVNALVVVPVVLVGVSVAARAYRRSRQVAEEAHEQEVESRAAIAADEELMTQLGDLEKDVISVLRAVADKNHADESDRQSLESLDARIRVALQVDASTDGAIPILAAHLIRVATDHERSINVRGIDHSPDQRPLNGDACRILETLVWGADPTIGVFFDGQHEHLFLTASIPEAEVPAPGIGGSMSFGDEILTLDLAPGGGLGLARIAAMLSRTRMASDITRLAGV